MINVHALFLDENPYNLYIGDTIKIKSNNYYLEKCGFVSSISVFYSNLGEPYYIYNITSREKNRCYNASISWTDDAGLLACSESINNITRKRLLLIERIVK